MNFKKLNENELSSFAANVLNLLAGIELDAIESHQRAELIVEFGTLPAVLGTQTDAADVAEDVRKAAISDRNETRLRVDELLSRVRDLLKAVPAPKRQFDLAGFDYPFTTSSTNVAQDPSDLAVTGTSNGVNSGRFSGNNKPGKVIYEIWRRQGDEGGWVYLAATRKQAFDDTGVTPGQFYEYKVRALAAKNSSNFSNTAVVYGAL